MQIERLGAIAMSEPLPSHLRPIVFATNELMLDLIYLLQTYTKADLESMLILLCVTDATMRPFMHEAAPTVELLADPKPSDATRGAISRRMIADKTGLSRETVRRKTQELAEAGLVHIDADGRVRSAQRLGEPEFARAVEAGHRVVVAYVRRLQSFGIDWENPLTAAPGS
jgi:DNA-binding transcriptional ArsR family regulator